MQPINSISFLITAKKHAIFGTYYIIVPVHLIKYFSNTLNMNSWISYMVFWLQQSDRNCQVGRYVNAFAFSDCKLLFIETIWIRYSHQSYSWALFVNCRFAFLSPLSSQVHSEINITWMRIFQMNAKIISSETLFECFIRISCSNCCVFGALFFPHSSFPYLRDIKESASSSSTD
jgi:hypothetical protein